MGNILDLLKKHDSTSARCSTSRSGRTCWVFPARPFAGVKTVYSHPQALMQCREYLAQAGMETVTYASTSLAAKHVREMGDPACAAIASAATAELYGLSVLARDINTSDDNTTRFILIAKSMAENGDRFSLLFTLRHEAGQLARVLDIVSAWALTWSASSPAPSKTHLGNITFTSKWSATGGRGRFLPAGAAARGLHADQGLGTYVVERGGRLNTHDIPGGDGG